MTTDYNEERGDGFPAIVTGQMFMAAYRADELNELYPDGSIQLTRTFSSLAWHEDQYIYANVYADVNADSEGENAEDLDTDFDNNRDVKEITFE